MSYVNPADEPVPARKGGISPKAIVGIVIALLVIGFIAVNREQTTISFLFFSTELALWVVLTIVAALGFIVGFLVSRRRYKP